VILSGTTSCLPAGDRVAQRRAATGRGHNQCAQPSLLFNRYGRSSGVQTSASGSGQRQQGQPRSPRFGRCEIEGQCRPHVCISRSTPRLLNHRETARSSTRSGPLSFQLRTVGRNRSWPAKRGSLVPRSTPDGYHAVNWLRVFEGRRIWSKPPRPLDSGDRWKDAPRKIVRSAQTPITTKLHYQCRLLAILSSRQSD
jgi:hypothetical protein